MRRVGVDQGWATSLSRVTNIRSFSAPPRGRGVGARGAGIGCKPRCLESPRNASFIEVVSRMKDIVGQTKQGMVEN